MKKKNEAGNLLPTTVTDEITVNLIPDSKHEFLMTSKDVALGYGVSESNIRNQLHRNQSEFEEGKHFGKAVCFSNIGLQAVHNKVFWTKRGIVRLGFFIKSKNAKLFRDWAEDLVLEQFKKKALPQPKYLSPRKHADTELMELIESAGIACGSANKLGRRLGVSPAVFSHLANRPWLVSEEMIKAIKIGCRNIISRGSGVDTATLDALMKVEDKDARVYLYEQIKKGGLL